MSSRTVFSIAFLLTLLFSVPTFASTSYLYEKLGGKHLKVLQNAKFVTMLTMVPEGAKNRYAPIQDVHLNQDEIDRLKRNILDDHNYDFGRVKSCQFLPEVSFKFTDEEGQNVHAFISPSCNQILFGLEGGSVLLNYDPVHERFEYFVQQLVNETRNRNKETARW